ncbi:ABC transporter permease [Paraburkholderia sp. J8-2]|uniref:ABC transporter permease n=1 Tax=Paraburkholderia sp. J8-2 TaxID=2805440 RepID=UPI002AB7C2C2|nr:ABC transporter permease [Paraburkholderia sp. J8-2]
MQNYEFAHMQNVEKDIVVRRWLTFRMDLPLLITIAVYVFLLAPLLIIIFYSFNSGSSTVFWKSFSWRWYVKILSDSRLQDAFLNSTIIAFSSALLATAVGTVTAVAFVKRDFPGKGFLATILMAPMVLPEIVLGVGMLVMCVFARVELGFRTTIFGHVLVALPFSIMIVRSAASALDSRLDEAAADLGANGWQIFCRITLPLLAPAIGTSFLMTATVSFDDFVMSTFVSGVGGTTLPLFIYSELKTGLTPEIDAIGTLMIVANVAVAYLGLRRRVAWSRQK